MKKFSAAPVILSIFLFAACHNPSSSTSQETSEEALLNTPQSEHVNKAPKAETHNEHPTAKPDSTTEHK